MSIVTRMASPEETMPILTTALSSFAPHNAPIVVGTSGDTLHLFLQLHGHCVKGSVDGFYHWLKSVDIESMSDLKYAVSDDVGFFPKIEGWGWSVWIEGVHEQSFCGSS